MMNITFGPLHAKQDTGMDPDDVYWTVRENTIQIGYGPNGRPYFPLVATCGDGFPEQYARLFAAAPDLLAACDGLLDVLDWLGANLPEETIIPLLAAVLVEDAKIAAIKAVAKAKGETP